MGKRIIRQQRLTDAQAERDAAIRAEFAGCRSRSAMRASGRYIGPMSIDEYLAWRRGEADAPLAKQLRAAIRSCGKPVLAIAAAAGVPQPVLQRFVNGERGITLDTAGKLAAYLGLALLPDPALQH